MLYRKPVLAMLLGLISLSFFGTLGVSAAMFPDNYDWRYHVISNLLSPRDNPQHYWLSACGVSLAALLMLPLAGYLRRHLQITSPRAAVVSGRAFGAGIVALICACLVVPQHMHAVLGIRRLHELLARSSAAFMAMGMLSGCWCAWNCAGQLAVFDNQPSRFAAWRFLLCSLTTNRPFPLIRHGRTCSSVDF